MSVCHRYEDHIQLIDVLGCEVRLIDSSNFFARCSTPKLHYRCAPVIRFICLFILSALLTRKRPGLFRLIVLRQHCADQMQILLTPKSAEKGEKEKSKLGINFSISSTSDEGWERHMSAGASMLHF